MYGKFVVLGGEVGQDRSACRIMSAGWGIVTMRVPKPTFEPVVT
jgi:hypothetical protein